MYTAQDFANDNFDGGVVFFIAGVGCPATH